MKSILCAILASAISAIAQSSYTLIDTLTNAINGCTEIHSWSYTNTGYQVPVLRGSAMSGVMKDLVFIGKETTNSPQIDPIIYLIGLTDWDKIRTMGVMTWQQDPIYYKVFTLNTGLQMERLTDVVDSCGLTNFIKFTLHVHRPMPSDVWWVLFYPEECKHRWAIPPIKGTNGPQAYLAARFFTGLGWRYSFTPLPGNNHTIAYAIYIAEYLPETQLILGPLRIEKWSNHVWLSWPQTNLNDIRLMSNMGWNMEPTVNRVVLPATNQAESFWLERRK